MNVERMFSRASILASDLEFAVPLNTLIIVAWVGTVVATSFTLLRTWLQFRHNKRFFLNDYLTGLALLFHIILSISVTAMITTINHKLQAPDKQTLATISDVKSQLLKYQFTALFIIWTALWIIKLAMLSFYWRLFASVKTNARVFWWIIFTITIATWVLCLFMQGFACSPPSMFFDSEAFVTPSCTAGFDRAFLASSLTDIITDLMIMVTPMPLLLNLQLARREKMILLVLFLTPLSAIIFSILRLVFLEVKKNGPLISPSRLFLYSTLELTFALVAACLPSLRLFFVNRSTTSSAYPQNHTPTPLRSSHKGAMALQPLDKSKTRDIETRSTEAILDPKELEFDIESNRDGRHVW